MTSLSSRPPRLPLKRRCEIHPELELVWYDAAEHEALCVLCKENGHHEGHKMQLVMAAVEAEAETLGVANGNAKATLSELREVKRRAETAIARHQDDLDLAVRTVNGHFDRLTLALKKQQEVVLQQLAEQRAQHQQTLKDRRGAVGEQVRALDELTGTTERLLAMSETDPLALLLVNHNHALVHTHTHTHTRKHTHTHTHIYIYIYI
jgi:hypothetical protein